MLKRDKIGVITWLASYPKSGNTWLRALLSAYLAANDGDSSLNRLIAPYVTVQREILEQHLGVESSDLLPREIERLKPIVFTLAASQAREPLIWKTHEAWRLTDRGESLFPICATGPSVYLVRNPLDIAVSFANHQRWSLEHTVQAMSDTEYCLGRDNIGARGQLYERLGSWSDHVRSWSEQDELDVMILRYEDLHADPVSEFSKVLRHLKLPITRDRVLAAVERSTFARLRAEEEESGFSEKNPFGGRFFRRGKVGAWRDELPSELVKQVRDDHGELMSQLGYTDLLIT